MIPELNWLAVVFILGCLALIFLSEDESLEDVADRELKKEAKQQCK